MDGGLYKAVRIIYTIIAILVFGLIVLIHELGHFICAKLSGISVEEFSIGMGPRILSIHGRKTRYSIKLLPFGGSCAMKGEDSSDETANEKGAFDQAPLLGRIITIAAGPVFNFILAWVAAVIIIGSVGIDRAIVDDVVPGYPAETAGIHSGDVITKIDNQKITIYRDLTLYMFLHPGKTVTVNVDRNTGDELQKLTFDITPKFDSELQGYMMGIQVSTGRSGTLGLVGTLRYSLYEVQYNITTILKSLVYILSGHASSSDVMGPVGLVRTVGETVEESSAYGVKTVILSILNLIVLISANLGVMNLLPLPALDGGRILFLLIELVRGKPVNRRVEGMVHLAGFALLMMLMILIMFNDIHNLIVG